MLLGKCQQHSWVLNKIHIDTEYIHINIHLSPTLLQHFFVPRLNTNTVLLVTGIPMFKIRRLDRLIFDMRISMLVRRHLDIEMPPHPNPPVFFCGGSIGLSVIWQCNTRGYIFAFASIDQSIVMDILAA